MVSEAKRFSHAYIISAPSPEETVRTARHMAAAAVCRNPERAPCGKCRDCRKAAADIHPDVITVRRAADDKGRAKREIGVDQIRWLIADAYVSPNEAERKIYIIEDTDRMNLAAQNAALKLLEEPPGRVMLLLCATNAALLLPTVRSRCVEVHGGTEAAETDAEARKLAEGYLKAAAAGDAAELLRWCAAHEGMDNRQAADFVTSAGETLTDMLCGRRSSLGMSPARMMALSALFRRCGDYLRVNTGVKHIFGLLAVDKAACGGNRGNSID